MDKAYSVLDIKIILKKNMYGEFFDVDTLNYNELRVYIDCLVKFENIFYWISEIEHIVSTKRESRVYKGKKVITY